MLQTAISGARNCGMVRQPDRVIIVHGHPPDKTNAPRITWEEAETPAMSGSDDENEIEVENTEGETDTEVIFLKIFFSLRLDSILK